ncbi:MAG TPA: type I DNA topoisomerase, partial [Gemmatimonadales bacterium]|nr:type I DNA topoisomerase [Gemmatimonadales bacterium]
MATAPKRTVKRAAPAKAAKAEEPAKKAAGRAKPKAEKPRVRAAAREGDALVIVESPTKAKTIGKYLGRGYDVKATIGHLRDLPTRELGVDVDNGFEPKYVTIKGKTKTLAELKKAAKTASTIYLATDPDREGEAIAWHVADQITPAKRVPVHRVLFEEITRDAVVAAMESPTAIDEKKVEAQQARRILDRLVGYKASPILWRTIKTGLSAGRVQTVALRLIVERERDIRAFKPQEYWTIEALCASGGQTFEASLAKIDGHKPVLGSEAEARAVVDAVRSLPFVVSKVEKRRRNKRPAAPFTTSTVQQEAAKKLGFSSRRTMRAAQDLYEGIEVGNEGAVGLITYMRTDSVRVADTAVASARELIQQQYGKRYLPDAPNVYSDRKNARVQGAHEAIRPTDVRRRPEEVQKFLEPDQFRLYQLIWQRFMASQMTPAQYDMTVVEFDLGKYLFRATGSVMIFDGYHVLYTEGREKEEGRQVEDLPPIPPLNQGDTVEVREITPSQHFTEPPPRFSEASLVKELERLGIGRPSTYSAIISTLSAREYVKVDQRRFFPTELGETVEKIMIGKFPEIFNVEFTSGMETELDRVEEGELGWQAVLQDFYGPFNKALGAVDMNALVTAAYGLSAEDIAKERCPKCGSQIELRTGRFGPYLACVKYKDTCDYVKSLKKAKTPDRPTDEKCHLCGSPMVIKTGRFGEFLACTTYPACKGTRAIPMGIKCPKCDVGDLAERRTKRGKSFWGCVRYPACDFSTWNKPVPDTCPNCGFVGMEKKVSKAEGETRTCLKCKHKIV